MIRFIQIYGLLRISGYLDITMGYTYQTLVIGTLSQKEECAADIVCAGRQCHCPAHIFIQLIAVTVEYLFILLIEYVYVVGVELFETFIPTTSDKNLK